MTPRRLRSLAVTLGVATLGSFVLASIGQAQSRTRIPLPTEAAVQRFGLVRKWFGYVPVDGVRERVERISVTGNTLFVQTDGSQVHALDAETGKPLWSQQVGLPLRGQFGVAANSKAAFVINGTVLYKLERQSGATVWSYELPQPATVSATADDEHVIVCTTEGRVYNYHSEASGPEKVRWYYQTNAPIVVTPRLHDDKVIAASQDGMLYVFGVNSRPPIFRYKTDAPVSAQFGVWGTHVFVPSEDYNVYAVDVRTGETYWRYTTGGPIRRPLVVVDNDLYVTPDDSGLYSLNVETGERQWWYPRASEFVAASGNRLYAGDPFGQVILLDRRTGQLLGTWDTHAFAHRVSNPHSDRIYLATHNGLIVCLHEKGQKEPLVHAVKAPPAAERPEGISKPAPETKPEGEPKAKQEPAAKEAPEPKAKGEPAAKDN